MSHAASGEHDVDDASLVRAALEGDKDSFAAVVERHRSTALALTGRVLLGVESASDAVQDATVIALVSLRRLRQHERFGAWFCGIALNVARRMVRDQRRVAAAAVAEDPDASLGPEEAVLAADMNRRVRWAVDALPVGQRRAVLLFYWQGLGHAEAAVELGVSVGAVKARLHQARRNLKPALVSVAEPEEVPPLPARQPSQPVEVVVVGVRRGLEDRVARRGHVVVLAERDGDRQLPIWIGHPEATALALNLEALEMPRPMTYQLAASLLAAGGAQISEVRITRLEGNTFYAVVSVTGSDGLREVDARPSDALNMALVTGAPISVDADLFDEPSVLDDPTWRDYPHKSARDLMMELHTFEVQQHPPTRPSDGEGAQA